MLRLLAVLTTLDRTPPLEEEEAVIFEKLEALREILTAVEDWIRGRVLWVRFAILQLEIVTGEVVVREMNAEEEEEVTVLEGAISTEAKLRVPPLMETKEKETEVGREKEQYERVTEPEEEERMKLAPNADREVEKVMFVKSKVALLANRIELTLAVRLIIPFEEVELDLTEYEYPLGMEEDVLWTPEVTIIRVRVVDILKC
jgi:hypothetical protein